jgi:hypothetical protein
LLLAHPPQGFDEGQEAVTFRPRRNHEPPALLGEQVGVAVGVSTQARSALDQKLAMSWQWNPQQRLDGESLTKDRQTIIGTSQQ